MIEDISILKNRWKQFGILLNYSSMYPEIEVANDYNFETFYMLGRMLNLTSEDFDRIRIVESMDNIIREFYLISPFGQLKRKKGIWYPIQEKIYDRKRLDYFRSYLFPSGIGGFIYEYCSASVIDDCGRTSGEEYLDQIKSYRDLKNIPVLNCVIDKIAPTNISKGDLVPANDADHLDHLVNLPRIIETLANFYDGNQISSRIDMIVKPAMDDKNVNMGLGKVFIHNYETNDVLDAFPRASFRKYQQNISDKTPFPLDTSTLTTPVSSNAVCLFHRLLQYLDDFPATELSSTINFQNKTWNLFSYCAYSPNQTIVNIHLDIENSMTIKNVRPEDITRYVSFQRKLRDLVFDFAMYEYGSHVLEAKIIKSSNNDAYITIVWSDKTVRKYYADFLIVALCSRSLLPDNGQIFQDFDRYC